MTEDKKQLPRNTSIVTVSMPEELAAEIDVLCTGHKSAFATRSHFMRVAAQEKLDKLKASQTEPTERSA